VAAWAGQRAALVATLAGALGLALAGGCASWSSFSTARTVAPGTVRWSPAVTVSGAAHDQPHALSPVQPQLELGVHVGVSEGFELGVRAWTLPSKRLWTIGGRLDTKIALLRSPDPNGGLDLALAPRLAYQRVGTGGAVAEAGALSLPLLIGINTGERTQIVFGPQVGGQVWLSDGADDVWLLTLGGSLGVAFWISDCFALFPEASIHWSTVDAAGDDRLWFFHFGLGVLFDS
jgi:hypothetical protein